MDGYHELRYGTIMGGSKVVSLVTRVQDTLGEIYGDGTVYW